MQDSVLHFALFLFFVTKTEVKQTAIVP